MKASSGSPRFKGLSVRTAFDLSVFIYSEAGNFVFNSNAFSAEFSDILIPELFFRIRQV